ncbi:gluconate 2-dehydrogenase subunit 3 family protein [Bartonella tamiae]|uniref:Tat (Twin-arginine translocation) pathway signal sequence n=1 Tax=Bartonella tamiae Th239 TaxID=1094558 RepID=J1K271_9HYPH|nr:gluconate 2-dehydrogenase subunit 3 family protein [Bartonella tamiae]EJF91562.1 hypothetical protein ME5_00257 [Bartonella tamiae Th239]EJF92454.1 hypothetical protein MEG_01624 [Bartonella tamiae Th307]
MTQKTAINRNFSITRRGLLVGAATCAAIALSARHVMAQPSGPVDLKTYQRSYFNAQEWAFILAATARLIPSEGKGPGALEARVPVFIDKQMVTHWGQGEHWYMEAPFDRNAPRYTGYQAAPSPAQAYRIAIPVINDWCVNNYGAIFADLSPDKQDDVLMRVEKDDVPIKELRSGDFFAFLLQNTKEGYLADPIYGGNHDMAAWVYIGFPGARGSFLEWVEKDNVPYRLGPVSLTGERA